MSYSANLLISTSKRRSCRMHTRTPVEMADRVSRGRAVVMIAATTVFLTAQIVGRPVFLGGTDPSEVRMRFWAINVVVLLLFLATGGGILRNRRLRALLNDEVSDGNRTFGIVAG